MNDYQQVIATLRKSYSREEAERRNQSEKELWKIAERQHFLDLLQQESKHNVLEIGAGTGADSLFFQQQGLAVISTDLSPDMVSLCREKGLQAYIMDFLTLDFPPNSFDAIYALNCLLHVPTRDLSTVLQKLSTLLRPNGLFFLCIYGGVEQEGLHEHDWCHPPRFFAHHTDEFMLRATSAFFDLVSFKAIPLENNRWHVQRMILRTKAE